MPHVSFYYDKKDADDKNILRLAVWAAAEAVDNRQPFLRSIGVNPPPFNPFRAPPATRLGRSA